MSKNTTRKGLAFGAGIALVATSLSSAPAFAADVDLGKYDADNEYVSLVPVSGTSYNVLDDQYLDLEANWTAGAGNGVLKFMIEDPEEITRYDVNTSASTTDTITLTDAGNVAISKLAAVDVEAGDLVSLFHASNATAHNVAVGDAILIDTLSAATATSLTAALLNGYHNVVGVSAYSGENPDTTGDVASGLVTGASGSGSFADAELVTLKVASSTGLEVGDIITIAGAAATEFETSAGGNQDLASALDGDYVLEAVGTGTVTFSADRGADAGKTHLLETGAAFTVTSNSITIKVGEVTSTGIAPTAPTGSVGDVAEATNANALDARGAILAATFGDTDAAEVKAEKTVAAGTAGRDDDGTYVLDTEDTANGGAAQALRLVVTDGDSGSVRVVAWVDADDDNTIDSIETRSAVRTVSFVDLDDVVPSITIDPVLVGDASMTATVTSTPALNWDQMSATLFQAKFNRQGRTDTLATADASSGVTYETWNTLTQTWTVTQQLKNTATNTPWTYTKPANFDIDPISKVAKSGTTVTLTTSTAHGLKVNDVITVVGTTDGTTTYDEAILSATSAKIVAATDFTFSYKVASNTTAIAETSTLSTTATDIAVTVGDVGFATAGTYNVTVEMGSTLTKVGTTASATAASAVAAGVENVATTSANVNGSFKVRKGYKDAVTVVSSVTSSAGTAVAAGVPVKIAVTENSTGVITVNGTTVTSSKTLDAVTNSAGQVVITVTNAAATAGDDIGLTVTSQGYSDASTLTWENAEYSLVDTRDISTGGYEERSIAAGGTVTFDLELADQFGQAPVNASRVKVALTGTRWSGTTYQTLTAGKATVAIADNPVATLDNIEPIVTFTTQQLSAGGVWTDGTTETSATMASTGRELHADAIKVNIHGANGAKVALNANGVTNADLAAPTAVKATAASDTRNGDAAVSFSTAVDESVNITGNVVDGLTESGTSFDGAVVTISGDSAILFRVGTVSAYGSLTFLAEGSNNGYFAVEAYSNKALTDSVVTVTALGASKTVEVDFTNTDAGTGVGLTIIAPDYVKAASTFQVKAQLNDKYGNGIDTAATRIKVTYTGPGIVFGTLPDQTDVTGGLAFSVLLGSNDSGPITVTVQYNQNGDTDFTDATDLSSSKTIIVNDSGTASKVNAGAFNGYVAVYALGHKGSTISWKIAGKWFKTTVTKDYQVFQRKTVDVGADVNVDIYIDGVKQLSKVVTTR